MFFRQLLDDDTACASYLFGCKSRPRSPSSTPTPTWSTPVCAACGPVRSDREAEQPLVGELPAECALGLPVAQRH
jgi:hypothetical protein